MTAKSGFRILLAGVGVLSFVPTVRATLYDVDLNTTNIYGRLDQTAVGPNSNVAGHEGENNFCAPTATMNSFMYLQTKFPTVYGNTAGHPNLMGAAANDTWTKAASELASGAFMGTDRNTGTTENNWVSGKVNYLETYAPGKTTYMGQDTLYTGNQAGISKTTKPNAQFLLEMLQKGADVEIGISPNGGGVGHVMTLTSIHWDDLDDDHTFNGEDTLSLDGIDPASPANSWTYTMVSPGVGGFYDGFMSFESGTFAGYRLDAALAEIPIPEPAAIALLSVALLTLARRRRM